MQAFLVVFFSLSFLSRLVFLRIVYLFGLVFLQKIIFYENRDRRGCFSFRVLMFLTGKKS